MGSSSMQDTEDIGFESEESIIVTLFIIWEVSRNDGGYTYCIGATLLQRCRRPISSEEVDQY